MGWIGENRRKFSRAQFPCLIKMKNDAQGVLAHTENISFGGVCVIIKKQFELYSLIQLELDLMDGEDFVSCQGKVVWIQAHKARDVSKPVFFETGVEIKCFTDNDSERIEKIISHLTKNSAVQSVDMDLGKI